MPTLKTVLDTYISYKTLRPRTSKQYRQFIERGCEDWLELEIGTIDKVMLLDKYKLAVNNVTKRAVSGGVGQANGLFRILRALFKFASIYWDLTLLNPIAVIRSFGGWRSLTDRTSHLKADQLADWYRALHELAAVDRDYLLIVLLTGARAGEIGELSWAELDLPAGMMHIPPERTKDKKWHHQPLSRQALFILRERKLLSVPSSIYVFSTSEDPTGPYGVNRRAYMRVERDFGDDCNPHALRRTFATHARYSCNIDRFIVKQCLNHSLGDITERYMVKDPEVLRVPFQQVSDFLFLKMRGEKPRITMPLSS